MSKVNYVQKEYQFNCWKQEIIETAVNLTLP